MFGENERNYVNTLVNHLPNVAKAQKYLKEHYGLYSEYDEEENTLYLQKSSNVNESLQLVSAKEYLEETFDPTMLEIKIANLK